MPPLTDDNSRWDDRIARARLLAARYSTATEILTFYAALAEYQKSLLRIPSPESPIPIPELFASLDLAPVLAAIPDFLSWLQRTAPARLADAAEEMRRLDRAEWRRLLESYFLDDRRNLEDAEQPRIFVLEALLQPVAELWAIVRRPIPESGIPSPAAAEASARLAEVRDADFDRERKHPESRIPNPQSRTSSACPLCRRHPLVGVLREEGHGAKRALLCGLCLSEWDYRRVICPACGEQQFDVLPIYTADQFAHVRIEACERCRTYLKTIDLTKDGLAIPLVDDLASVSLDLWARQQGYVRLSRNLLGL